MINARVLADSTAPSGARLTTFEVTIPRIVLAEFNTHRMFSRNSASSRAIPVQKMLERVKSDPFIPLYWGKNQKGMSADEEIYGVEKSLAESEWLLARDNAVKSVEQLLSIGIHKQITNRLLEPFLWHTVIFTATELDNFYALRNSKHAQPEIRKPTQLIIEAYESSKPVELRDGEWHLPLVTGYEITRSSEESGDTRWLIEGKPVDHEKEKIDWHYWAQISTARCARVSYLTHEGKRDLAEDIKKCGELITNGHMSPLEHPAMALSRSQWRATANTMATEWVERRRPVGNFWGFYQFRKTIDNEHDFSRIIGEKKEEA